MGLQRHVGGSLKQTNKKHKGERKRCDSTKISNRTQKSNKKMSKKARKLQAKQQRMVKNKIASNAHKSFNKPLMCLLLPLHEDIDLNLTQRLLSKGDPGSSMRMRQLSDMTLTKRSYKVNYLNCPLIKKEFFLVNGMYNDLIGNLDLARLADWIIFVLPGDMSKFDPEHYSEMLTTLYSQGLTSSTFCVMSNLSDTKELLSILEVKFPVSDGKVRTLNSTGDALNLLRFLSQSQKKPFSMANNYLNTPNALKVGTTATRLRCGMLAEAVFLEPHEENENEVYLKVEGLLRGWDLPLYDISQSFTVDGEVAQTAGCPFLHLTGWGDFPLRGASWIEHQTGGLKLHQADPVPTVWKAMAGPDANLTDALSTVWNNMQLDDSDEDDVSDESENDSDEEMAEDEDEVEVGDIPPDSDGETNNYLDIEDDVSVTTSKAASVRFKRETMVHKIPAKQITTTADKVKAAKIELEFPDEVETPQDMSARDRFVKYRGLPSFSKCAWPTENDTSLPYEYGKIFRFGNYAHNRRTLIKHTLRQLRHLAMESVTLQKSDQLSSTPQIHRRIPSGSVASLTLGPMPASLASALVSMTTAMDGAKPLTLWSLLPYERCLSVLHATMQKRILSTTSTTNEVVESGNSEIFDPDPLMNKEPMLYQVGIRRFTAAPIYSQANKAANTNSKMEKFFTLASSPIVATMYAPVCYAPQAVLQFRIHPTKGTHQFELGDLIATGSVLACDPTRAIVKRILLSGHPYKIHKRGAVVRYMFNTPEDIEYFKPIQLHTKCGAVGHIKQSVGTHGLMKCLFDRPVKAHDVILLPLYKRVFPKMSYDSSVTGRLQTSVAVQSAGLQTVTGSHSQGILKAHPGLSQAILQESDQEMKFSMLTADEEALFH